MADTHWLVQELQAALGEYGGAFWDRLRPAQLAAALVATPYPLCAVSVGIHISAHRACSGTSSLYTAWWPHAWSSMSTSTLSHRCSATATLHAALPLCLALHATRRCGAALWRAHASLLERLMTA